MLEDTIESNQISLSRLRTSTTSTSSNPSGQSGHTNRHSHQILRHSSGLQTNMESSYSQEKRRSQSSTPHNVLAASCQRLNKQLLYITVLRPVWSYNAPIWGCAADSNLLIVQRLQNLILRKITGAPWFIKNHSLHQDLDTPTIKEVVGKLAYSYERRLYRHSNILAILLLEEPPITRLKRGNPGDFATY